MARHVPNSDAALINICGACIFVALILLSGYILVRYLLCQNKSKQKSMILFYSLSMIDLVSRVAYFVMACYRPLYS